MLFIAYYLSVTTSREDIENFTMNFFNFTAKNIDEAS